MFRLWILTLSLVLPSVAISADDNPLEASDMKLDYNEALETPWVELETRVQQLPKEADLTEVELDKLPKNLRLYADLQNINISDQDYVTRLWIVVRSKQGAYNGSYEGYRCATKEYKAYAYANPKRSEPLRVVQFPRWRPIKQGQYRDELARWILCNGTRPHSPDAVLDNLHKDSTSYDLPN